MPQDAFTLRYIAEELNQNLKGGKISRINQPSKDALILLIYTRNGTVKLDLDFSAKFCRASLGEGGENINPAVAPGFCMLLRKHLSNAEILEVAQVGFERVLYVNFKCFSEFEITTMRLYLEIMGKYSNAVLVKDGIIVGALKSTSLESAKRVMFTGAVYKLPDRQDKADPTNLAELEAAFKNKSGDCTSFIANRIAGISYVTAADIVEKFGEDLTAEQLYSFVNKTVPSPCVTEEDFKVTFTPGAKAFDSILKAQASFYFSALTKRLFEDKKRKLLSAVNGAVKKTEKRLCNIYEKLEECAKCEGVKLCGELITANIYAVKRGDTHLFATNYYDPEGGTVDIALDPTLTPSQNAQKYYKRYAKLKRTADNLSGQRDEYERKKAYLETVVKSLEIAENIADFAGVEEELTALSLIPPPPKRKGVKQQEASAFRTYNYMGFTVLCGRNNTGNDKLTKLLLPDDIWLHTKSYHSSHAAIRADKKEIVPEVIKFAAEVCAHYSEARGRDKIPVDYTFKKYVKKPGGANPGFVVYTDFKTILVAPNAHLEELIDE